MADQTPGTALAGDLTQQLAAARATLRGALLSGTSTVAARAEIAALEMRQHQQARQQAADAAEAEHLRHAAVMAAGAEIAGAVQQRIATRMSRLMLPALPIRAG